MSLKVVPLNEKRGPWRGVVSDLPVPLSPDAFVDAENFLFRLGRIQTRPRFNNFTVTPDGAPALLLVTFLDATNLLHTMMLTSQNAYMLTNPPPVWHLLGYPGGVVNLGSTYRPYGNVTILNRVYFANGAVPVMYSDGETTLKIAGDVPGSARFMAENQQTLIIAATTEPAPGVINSTFYPNRVRWSANGLPDEWDPLVDFSAGFNDLIEVPDVITGIATLGRNTYVWRTNGITVMYPTGIGTAPFAFEDFSVAPEGCGNIYPYSLDVFNNTAAFVSSDTIRSFDGSNMNPIATGKTRKRIYADLAASDPTRGDLVIGRIMPSMGPNFPYLAYWLSIQGPDISWVYNFDEESWTRVRSSEAFMSALGLVSVGV